VVDAWNTRSDDLHHTPNNPRDDLKLRVRPYVTRITQADGGDFAQVVLFYEWDDSSFFVSRTRADAFTMIIAPVSSY
jgi:hypothetical protein